MTDCLIVPLLWRMRMRLTNVDRANSCVLAKPQAYKIPIWTYEPTWMSCFGGKWKCSLLLGHGAKLKAHADMFLNMIMIMSLWRFTAPHSFNNKSYTMLQHIYLNLPVWGGTLIVIVTMILNMYKLLKQRFTFWYLQAFHGEKHHEVKHTISVSSYSARISIVSSGMARYLLSFSQPLQFF